MHAAWSSTRVTPWLPRPRTGLTTSGKSSPSAASAAGVSDASACTPGRACGAARIDAATGSPAARSLALVANLSSASCIAAGNWPTIQQRSMTASSGWPANSTVFAHSRVAPAARAAAMPSGVSGNTQSRSRAGSGLACGVATFTHAMRSAWAISAPLSA
ncbi:hypothetical protein [Massilia timonae]|uniref:hypothetical protein n=1 Tax=Massilia timonae TaxID=47229 RepID=UPI002896D17E|nr:hypothetical protein [Massilia timonae]